MTRAGEMDRMITFRQNTPTQNDLGEPIASWSTLAVVWARVRPVREEEKFTFEQSAAFEQMEFTVRFQERFKDYKLAIVHDSKTFDILAIKEVGRREALAIIAKAQV